MKRGIIKRADDCECCGAPAVEMHHTDYSRPLYVFWLCRPCHNRADRRLRDRQRSYG